MQVNTSGLRPRSGKARLIAHMAAPKPCSKHQPASSRTVIGGYALSGVKISCLPRLAKSDTFLTEGRHLRKNFEPEVAPLELAFA